MNNQDIQEAFEHGERIDRAMDRAFFEAVRLHRRHKVPMALWEDGQVHQVDPFFIPLPEDEATHAVELGASRTRDRSRRVLERDYDM